MINLRRWWLGRTEVVVPWAVQAVAVVWTLVYAATRGWAYLPWNRPDNLTGAIGAMTAWSGITPWAIAWLTAAAVCLIGLVKRRPRWCLGVAIMAGLWGFGYAITGVREWIVGTPSRDYLTALSYLYPAGMIALWVFAAKVPDRDRPGGRRARSH